MDSLNSIWETAKDNALRIVTAGTIGALTVFGATRLMEDGDVVYEGRIDGTHITYVEDEGTLEFPLDGLQQNYMVFEEDGNRYRITDSFYDNDIDTETRDYSFSRPEKVTVQDDDTTETYTGASLGTLAKGQEVYNTLRREIKRRLLIRQNMGDDFVEDRRRLVSSIYEQWRKQDHTYRRGADYDEHFNAEKAGRFSIEELNQVSYLLNGLQQEETRNAIGEMVRNDLKDSEITLEGITDWGRIDEFTIDPSQTELGGLIRRSGEGIELIAYEPDKAKTDEAFYLTDSYIYDDALATFHLHAVDDDGNRKYAGPSNELGDLGVADSILRSGVVITYLGDNYNDEMMVNVDYYTPDGDVIDLGDYNTRTSL